MPTYKSSRAFSFQVSPPLCVVMVQACIVVCIYVQACSVCAVLL